MSEWKLVPVEPTEQMLDAMQESALVSFDAAIEAELNNGPAVESLHRVVYRAMLAAAPEAPSAEPYCYIYEYDVGSVVHREFHPHEYNGRKPSRTVPLYATPPEAPSAEPCPYIRSSAEGTHWCSLAAQPAPSAEPVAWMHHYADGEDTTWAVDGISDPLVHCDTRWTWVGCSPLYPTPPDHREAMRLALAALIELQHGHARTVAPGIQPVIDALRAALGESK